MKVQRNCILIAGLKRHGKTYYTEQKAKAFARSGGCSIAYNVGNPSDFKDFLPVELLTPIEYYKRAKKLGIKIKPTNVPDEINFFIVQNKVYHIKDFRKILAGKCVKINGLHNKSKSFFPSENDMFCEAIYKYFYDCFIIFDDNARYTKHGISANMEAILSRNSHCGFDNPNASGNFGVSIALIYHGLDLCPVDFYDYITHIVLFKLQTPPKLIKGGYELSKVCEASYYWLKDNPKYSRVEIDTIMLTAKEFIFKP